MEYQVKVFSGVTTILVGTTWQSHALYVEIASPHSFAVMDSQ